MAYSGEIDRDLNGGGQGAGPADQRVQGPLTELGETSGDNDPDVASVEIDVDGHRNLVVHGSSFRYAKRGRGPLLDRRPGYVRHHRERQHTSYRTDPTGAFRYPGSRPRRGCWSGPGTLATCWRAISPKLRWRWASVLRGRTKSLVRDPVTGGIIVPVISAVDTDTDVFFGSGPPHRSSCSPLCGLVHGRGLRDRVPVLPCGGSGNSPPPGGSRMFARSWSATRWPRNRADP